MEKKVNIIKPKVGEKLKHIKLAEKNATENIKLKKASLDIHKNALEELKILLNMEEIPNRIEVYDNSHTFGKESVGVMIVVEQEGFSPKNYRKFNIRYNESFQSKSTVDDYYMIKEVLTRRLGKIEKNTNSIIPDVIIIDGGKGHLGIANKIILDNNLSSIATMSVSKGIKRNSGKEIIHTLNNNQVLKASDPLLFFIQKIRDEAHRFAITTHRKRRGKYGLRSLFDDIKGIGPKRKKTLISHFGAIKNIRNASYNEIMNVKGITKKLAQKIYGFFHS